MGAFTAAEYTSKFFENIVNENTISSRQLIIHEVMGRNCGWLTAYSAYLYRKSLYNKTFVNSLMLDQNRWDIHAVYVPELSFDLDSEVKRLNEVMYDVDCINIFLSEGAGIENIINEMKSNNIEIKYDAFGHPRLDEINPGYAQEIMGYGSIDIQGNHEKDNMKKETIQKISHILYDISNDIPEGKYLELMDLFGELYNND